MGIDDWRCSQDRFSFCVTEILYKKMTGWIIRFSKEDKIFLIFNTEAVLYGKSFILAEKIVKHELEVL